MKKVADIVYMKKSEPDLLPIGVYEAREIHLAIKTNILCVDDRLEAKYLGSELNDFTATLYLGKIIFEKNKQGILAPKFIPTTITDSRFNGLNTFWLNAVNPNAKKPFKSMIECDKFICVASADSIPYQKIRYFRHKDNIVLNKEQIISYFTELHQKNTTFTQNYIDSINANRGIKAYHLNDRLYENLTQKGILPESMIKRYTDTHKIIRNNALDLIALDYLAKTHQSNFKILLYDELFYAYLAWSLREFLIDYSVGQMQSNNNLLFNSGAYKTIKEIKQDAEDIYPWLKPRNFFSNLSYSSQQYRFVSPNQALFTKGQPITPSPLGKYYFELSDNKGVYIEFFDRIYPSITNPPKGWSKEMMRKLELKLE